MGRRRDGDARGLGLERGGRYAVRRRDGSLLVGRFLGETLDGKGEPALAFAADGSPAARWLIAPELVAGIGPAAETVAPAGFAGDEREDEMPRRKSATATPAKLRPARPKAETKAKTERKPRAGKGEGKAAAFAGPLLEALRAGKEYRMPLADDPKRFRTWKACKDAGIAHKTAVDGETLVVTVK